MAGKKPLVLGTSGVQELSSADNISVPSVIESTSGGFKFPDGTTQTTAVSGSSYTQKIYVSDYNLVGAGASIEVTSIPAWAKRITVTVRDISSNGSSLFRYIMGGTGSPEGAYEYSGYSGYFLNFWSASQDGGAFSSGLLLWGASNSPNTVMRTITSVFTLVGTGCWKVVTFSENNGGLQVVVGGKEVAGSLQKLQLGSTNGTDVFDSGIASFLIEG